MAETTAAATSSPSGAKGPALDELMLAMDVVDTLRHQEDVALRELAQDGRDDVLKERLRRIYESQGLTVSDRILDEGIKALKESRFTYEQTPPGLSRTLAGLWVRRGAFGKALAVLVVLAVAWIGWSVWQQTVAERTAEAARIELTETLPRQIAAAGQAALAEARTDDARERVEQLQSDASAALARSDAEAARVALADLDRVRGDLMRVYELRIVSRPGEQSGIFRIPDVNSGARNYYLIVEAVTPDGQLLSFPIRSEENGQTKTVSKWGVRVPQQTYEAVRRDKTDDGILQGEVLATKPRGALEPVFSMAVSGGEITEW
ncbi:DUF6384 family protein [Neorhizobium sp. CSC1952]|uniref:DUF6384 family protein n=1 Tax=Neorhizobium sp. CSC1952 TaxID=2978974 RepID=UPI0025A550FF|nr:DUF6384 family protein [Rhizobium sp. CSC1952]WJR68763.1 DUF6384 family protein [Rhizobium sp. CSC1952]